ncbi:MAG: hypothetical protein Fur005_40440 [Roseiflexaceae bacterium]
MSDRGTRLRGCFVTFDLDNAPVGGLTPAMKQRIIALPTTYGFNALHVYLEQYGMEVGSNAAICDELVELTAQAGMYLILVIGNHPGTFHAPFVQRFWDFYIGRYTERTHVIYEIQNEPAFLCNEPSSPAELITMEIDAYHTIRRSAPHTHILLCSYAEVPHSVIIQSDIQSLTAGGVDFSNASFAYHGYYWCAGARDSGGYANNTEHIVLDPFIQQGYSFTNTEFDEP